MKTPRLVFLLLAATTTFGKFIEKCPVTKRNTAPPTSVHDLHPSDIEVVAGIGDSISCGLAARNVNTEYVSPEQLIQWRGVSFTMGGDYDEATIPNFMQHYSPRVVGASTGARPLRVCEKTFFCMDETHDESTDHFNAALPATGSLNITEQVKYLIQRIGPGTEHEHKWKYITIYLGQNDLALSCYPGFDVLSFAKRIEEGLELLKNIKNTFVSLVGLMHTEKFIHITDKEPGYRKMFSDPGFEIHDYECYCCHVPLLGNPIIGLNVPLFNGALENIAKKFKSSDSFVVTYLPFSIRTETVPPEALSNLDGFHPSVFGHQFMARVTWNQLFLPDAQKRRHFSFDADLPVYCPTETDRLQTR